ncbi:tyrosyl-tRNA synthetase [Filimonas lacunae]|uniref:Tyrosine--tRNA ligase n=1 Tax=Filimonas lacunae TaxID=477680 RepID=A0A173MBA6_9BACT|nr:tyrosine--tRNA ligase [Filimonas lacunae]BAV04758.1 tyrosyl-tRNA synthetase [Filimonas lacunae]SIT32156.1 tyrosyl-tRNA synthetase [Filimonas lacunae]
MQTVQLLQENVDIILPANGLEQKLALAEKESRKLVIKLGFDPTAPDLHLGHAVVLKKLKQFQELGHQVVIIVGSFTAQIGDPTGKNKSRKPLSKAEVLVNAETYIQQLSTIMDVAKCQVRFNSDWLAGLGFAEILQLLAKVTVAQLMHRNDFNKRFTENTPIAMHELMYPILQGFDSVEIQADVEMGGTDQLFNCTMGRQLQESHDMAPQVVMCMPLLKGLDGTEKMSKSLHNTIGLTDTPNEMFGKTMSIPDHLIEEWLELTTSFTSEERTVLKGRLQEGENPMNIKKLIAKNIIAQYHDKDSADAAELFFTQQFQHKGFDDKNFTPVAIASLGDAGEQMRLLELCILLKQDETKTNVRRLITSGAVLVNNEKVTDAYTQVELLEGTKIKIGKRCFIELVG